jgi:hypothetical protein
MITAGYAGYLLAPLGAAARVAVGVVGLVAAFGHFVPNVTKLAVGAGLLAAIAGLQWARQRARQGGTA